MHVAIDARFINIQNLHGMGRYIYELVKNIASIDQTNQYSIICSNSNVTDKFDAGSNINFIDAKSKPLSLSSQIEIPFILHKLRPDIFHSPTFDCIFLQNFPVITTIHDLIHLKLPRRFAHILYYKYFISYIIKCSIMVLTDSRSSKDDINEMLHVQENKIKVVYMGVNENFKPMDCDSQFEKIRCKYNLRNRHFILYVGNKKHHKNLERLIIAFSLLLKERKINCGLVIAGSGSIEEEKKLIKISSDLSIREQVDFIGFVQDADLPSLYNSSNLFAFPSLYEGFGLPVLEAMACGIPVVTSNVSSLPEVGGNAVAYCDPYDVRAIANEINKIFNNARLREKMICKGLEQCKLFSWRNTAKETLKGYMESYDLLKHKSNDNYSFPDNRKGYR